MKKYLVLIKLHYDGRISDSVYLQTAKNMQDALNRIIEKNSKYLKDKIWVVQSICVCDKSCFRSEERKRRDSITVYMLLSNHLPCIIPVMADKRWIYFYCSCLIRRHYVRIHPQTVSFIMKCSIWKYV